MSETENRSYQDKKSSRSSALIGCTLYERKNSCQKKQKQSFIYSIAYWNMLGALLKAQHFVIAQSVKRVATYSVRMPTRKCQFTHIHWLSTWHV